MHQVINTPGTYTFKWFVRQSKEERGKVDGQQGSDLGNDVWLRFLGGIGRAGLDPFTKWVKFYGRSDPGFWLHGIAEYDYTTHDHRQVSINIPCAGIYTMEICGRSHGYQIDKIVMGKDISNWGYYTEKTEIQARKYWSETGTLDSTGTRFLNIK